MDINTSWSEDDYGDRLIKLKRALGMDRWRDGYSHRVVKGSLRGNIWTLKAIKPHGHGKSNPGSGSKKCKDAELGASVAGAMMIEDIRMGQKKWCRTLFFQNLGSWKEYVSKMFWTSTGPFLSNHNVGKRKQPRTFSPEKGSGKRQREDLCRGMQALPSSPRPLLHPRLGCLASGSDLKLAWTWVWSLGDNKHQGCNMEGSFISICRLSEESHNKRTIPRTTGGVEVGHTSTQWELTCGKMLLIRCHVLLTALGRIAVLWPKLEASGKAVWS